MRNLAYFFAFALVIIRCYGLAVEYAGRLGKCQVIGQSMKITVAFGLLNVDCLEKESFPFHVHKQHSHFPLTWCNFCLPDFKAAALV